MGFAPIQHQGVAAMHSISVALSVLPSFLTLPLYSSCRGAKFSGNMSERSGTFAALFKSLAEQSRNDPWCSLGGCVHGVYEYSI